MNGNDNTSYNDNTNTFNLKTMPVKDTDGNILEPSVYLDSDVPMNKVDESSETSELTKEQLERMKETITTEIAKTTKEVSYNDLVEIATYNSSDTVREQAKAEIKRRIISGEVFEPSPDVTFEHLALGILNYIDDERREYLQRVARSKGNVK